MYRLVAMLELLQRDATHKIIDGLVCHVADSKTWAHVNEKCTDFAHDLCNLKLIISTDGFNPFFEKSCQWSTWHVYVLIYNLPPWLTTKRFFVLVALIILGKESVCMKTIDVYLQ
jgi:hypothetical protein